MNRIKNNTLLQLKRRSIEITELKTLLIPMTNVSYNIYHLKTFPMMFHRVSIRFGDIRRHNYKYQFHGDRYSYLTKAIPDFQVVTQLLVLTLNNTYQSF